LLLSGVRHIGIAERGVPPRQATLEASHSVVKAMTGRAGLHTRRMLDMSRAAGGISVNRIVLRGMTWQHRRALDPLLGTLPAFRALHPAIDVAWDARPLAGFEFTPVAELVERYDLVILYHPFVGDIAGSECLLPLDGLADETSDRAFVGPSLASYR
jgi:hypothetical protein